AGTAFVAALAQLERKPLLVVLAACQGAGTSYEVLRAVGPQLARVGVGAVLAMREQIPQATVAALLPPLFAELRRDGALDRALAAARAALGETHPWWLPVLWLRTRDGLLWREETPPSPPPPSGTTGTTNVSGTVNGAAVGVNQGTIQLFFGQEPPVDAKLLLDSYLQALIAEHGYLRLGKLLERERTGYDQAIMPEIALLKVYTTLTTDRLLPVGPFALGRRELRSQMDATDPDRVLPEKVLLPVFDARKLDAPRGVTPRLMPPLSLGDRVLSQAWQEAQRTPDEPDPLVGHWYRPESLIPALSQIEGRPRMVLLGSPGSGKSTGMRHLTVFIATALLSGTKTLRIPFFCPLGLVAQALGDDPDQDVATLVALLLRPALGAGELRVGVRAQVQAAILAGNAFLFFDGLDEVSGVPEPTRVGLRSRRERVADAIRTFAHHVGVSPVVVTCRTRPYEQDAAWHLREGWALRRLQPFAFGQVRNFITKWYAATCIGGQGRYALAEATTRAERLITLLDQPHRSTLRELTASPLVLTMLVLLDYNNTRMPERRADVYEELVKLLLDRWEGVRSSEVDRRPQRIGERLGLPHLTIEELRPALHELAFTAHQQLVDGRGVITGPLLRETLDWFFARKLDPARPALHLGAAAVIRERFMGLLIEESGLLLEDAPESEAVKATYVFPHLTFEEYLAGCHLAGRDGQGIDLAYTQWETGGERWREVVYLLMGRLLRQEKYDNLFLWLQRLVAVRCGPQVKLPLQHQRDILLAVACYAEVEGRAAFATTHHDLVRFEDDLRSALVTLLERPDPTLVLSERLEAAEALAELDDPRFPTTAQQWQAEWARRTTTFGQPTGYWCYVSGGQYQIGGWPEDAEAKEGMVDKLQGVARRLIHRGTQITLPAFWLARYPITVAQYAPFVAEGYREDAEHWWTKAGWQWKQAQKRRQPWGWNDATDNGPNQ
ncbi:MAG: SUMF1/EgtB/PvdO family nonheme iron enzyme, partial [Chloroflexales bacterium]